MLELFRTSLPSRTRTPIRAAREKIAGRFLLLDESLREFLPLVFDFHAPAATTRQPLAMISMDSRALDLHAAQQEADDRFYSLRLSPSYRHLVGNMRDG
jgi:hypothetical protein